MNSASAAPAEASNSVATRLRVLEDIHEITELKHRYGVALDNLIAGPNGAGEFVDLFVSDFQVDYDVFGVYTDKAALTALLEGVIAPTFAWGFHVVQNPRINVNGDSATGEWYLTAQVVYEGGTEIVPFYGRYVDQYVRTADGWKFKSSVLVFDWPLL
jgi:hypothetical protein